MDSIIILRAMERVLAVVVGGFCIYLGYRLFLRIPEQKEGEAEIKFPGDISIYIARVGPGVFFALFGAVIVGLSFYLDVEYFQQTPNHTPADQKIGYYRGLTPTQIRGDLASTQGDRLRLGLEIEYLNTLSGRLRKDLSERQRIEFETRTESIKLALMHRVWGSDWGDFNDFQLWVEAGADDPVPESLVEPAEYFRSGQGLVP